MNEELMLDDDGAELRDFIIIGDRVEIDFFLFYEENWAMMGKDFVVVHVEVTDSEKHDTEILAISALSVNKDGRILSKFNVFVKTSVRPSHFLLDKLKPNKSTFEDKTLDLKQALEALQIFSDERAVFIYKELHDTAFLEDACIHFGVASSMRLIDVAEISLIVLPGDHANSIRNMVTHLGIQVNEDDFHLNANLILQILLAIREKCREYHYRRISLLTPCLKNGYIRECQVYCRFCQTYHPIIG